MLGELGLPVAQLQALLHVGRVLQPHAHLLHHCHLVARAAHRALQGALPLHGLVVLLGGHAVVRRRILLELGVWRLGLPRNVYLDGVAAVDALQPRGGAVASQLRHARVLHAVYDNGAVHPERPALPLRVARPCAVVRIGVGELPSSGVQVGERRPAACLAKLGGHHAAERNVNGIAAAACVLHAEGAAQLAVCALYRRILREVASQAVERRPLRGFTPSPSGGRRHGEVLARQGIGNAIGGVVGDGPHALLRRPLRGFVQLRGIGSRCGCNRGCSGLPGSLGGIVRGCEGREHRQLGKGGFGNGIGHGFLGLAADARGVRGGGVVRPPLELGSELRKLGGVPAALCRPLGKLCRNVSQLASVALLCAVQDGFHGLVDVCFGERHG